MSPQKRKMSTPAKVVTALIYLLAIALLVTVIHMNMNTTPKTDDSAEPETSTTVYAATGDELPYNRTGSDKYANVETAYPVSQVSLMKEADGTYAYVNGSKVEDYTGVAKGEGGWYFVRDGVVDTNYNGIAGNELGNWYIADGKVNFSYSGSFTVNNTTYTVENGKVVS